MDFRGCSWGLAYTPEFFLNLCILFSYLQIFFEQPFIFSVLWIAWRLLVLFLHFFLLYFSCFTIFRISLGWEKLKVFFFNIFCLNVHFKFCMSACTSVRSWRSRRLGSGRKAPSWALRVMGRTWAVCWSYYRSTKLWLENYWLTVHCCRCVCMCAFMSLSEN